MATTNYTLTNIAIKRVSGKAQVSINNNVNQELIGSSVQSSNSTVFGETVPNAPAQTLYLIQSASVSDPGTAMYVEFKVYPIGDSLYANDPVAAGSDDEGDVTTNTYHAYALHLSSAFDDEVVDFNTHASTGTSFGSFPFVGGSYLTGSAGKFQLIPSFLSTDTSTNNSYIPTLYSNEGAEMQASDPSDWYLDPFSGILFIQDPTQYGTPNGDGSSPNTSTSIPGKVRAFIYVGKYQDEVTFTANDVNFIVSGSDEGFAVGNDDTINFVSGSAGITVVNDGTDTITIGASTDNVTFNQITASIINADTIEVSEFIVSSSVTYMTQSFSSGSTIFGDTLDDTHLFTGSLYITSALNTGNSGSIIANSWISASDLYLTNTFTALDGGVTVTSNASVELYVDGNITASGDISASGLLFANATEGLGGANIEVAMYDTTTGQFYYTGSEALGDTTLLEASASAGIHFISGGSATAGTSVGLAQTASFVATGTGLTVGESGGTITYTITPDDVLNGATDTATFNFTSSHAEKTVQVYIGDEEDIAQARPIIFAGNTNGTGFQDLKSDGSSFLYNPGDASLRFGVGGAHVILSSGSLFSSGDEDEFDIQASANAASTLNIGYNTAGSINALTAVNIGLFPNDTAKTTTTVYGETIFKAYSASADLSGNGTDYGVITTGSFSLNLVHPNSASFNLVNVSESSERTPLVIDNNGKITKADADFAVDILVEGDGLTVLSSNAQGEVTGGNATTAHLTDADLGLQTTDNVTFAGLNVGSTNAGTITIGTDASSVVTIGNADNTVTFNGSASIAGDLIVQGAVTSIQTENLNVADQFILLNSGAASATDTGIIVQTNNTQNIGSALYWDTTNSRWEIDYAGANASSNTVVGDAAIVAVRTANSSTPLDPYMGAVDAGIGQMYVDTGDNDNDGNNIWIYA